MLFLAWPLCVLLFSGTTPGGGFSVSLPPHTTPSPLDTYPPGELWSSESSRLFPWFNGLGTRDGKFYKSH